MKVHGFEFPDELYYDKQHNWAKVEGNVVTQGITDFAQKAAKEIVYAEVPRAGRTVKQGDTYMSLESGKWVGRITAIVSGKIMEGNEQLEFDATCINSSPFQDGWLAKIEATDLANDLKNLFKASDPVYHEHILAEKKKFGLE